MSAPAAAGGWLPDGAFSAKAAGTTGAAFLKFPAGSRTAAMGGVSVAAAKGAEVWLALIDRRHSTKIPRGENEGRTLVNDNVVREWKKLGEIADAKMELSFVAAGEKGEKRGAAAVIVQQPKSGPILGAALAYLE